MTYKNGFEWYDHQPDEIKKLLGDELIIYDAYYDAILGFIELPTGPVLLYSTKDAIEELAIDMKQADEQEDDPYTTAVEYWDFNVAGGWVGNSTPLLLQDSGAGDIEAIAFLKQHNPGFVGFATRCSDKTYAIFDTPQLPGELVVPTEDTNGQLLDIIIPFPDMLTLRRITNEKVVPGVREETHG